MRTTDGRPADADDILYPTTIPRGPGADIATNISNEEPRSVARAGLNVTKVGLKRYATQGVDRPDMVSER